MYTSDERPDLFHDYESGYAGDPELARGTAQVHYPTLIPPAAGVQYGEYEAAMGTGQAIFWFDV